MDQNAERDEWAWWQEARRVPGEIGRGRLAIHESEPQTGFYRVRLRDGQWQTVAIFRDMAGGLAAERNGHPVPRERIEQLWIWACRNPVSYEAYQQAREGGGWEDEPERAPGIGDNIKDADPHDALMIEFQGERELAEEFLAKPITDQDAADRAAIWAKRLNTISKKATEQHKVEKQPSLDEGRRIDDRWRALKEDPHSLATRLKRHSDAWFQEQDRLERERAWKAQQEAERLEREARQAAEKADEADDIAAQAEAGKRIAEVQAAKREAEYKRPQAGRTGAKVSMRTYYTGEIIDIDQFFAAVKEREEVNGCLQTIANRMAKAMIELPGMKIVEERRVV